MLSQQIAAALPLMYHAFPGVDRAGVEILSTIPSFGIIFGLLVSPLLVKKWGAKMTVILGLTITLVMGIIPMLSANYPLILISRLLVGLGIGLFNSLAVSLIPYFYDYDENVLATMVGMQNVMAGIGVIISSLLVSYLVTFGWHPVFAIYLLVVPSLLMFAFFVPLKAGHQKEQAQSSTPHPKQKINRAVILIAVLFFFVMTFYTPLSFDLPRLLVEQGMGTASTAALITSISTLVCIPFGMCFGFLYKHLHDKIFPLSQLLLCIGFLVIALSSNVILVFVGIIILSLGLYTSGPYLYNWLDWAAPTGSVNLGTTIILVAVNVGTFISPVIVDWITGIFKSGSARSTMWLCSIVFLLMTVYGAIHYVRVHNLHEKLANKKIASKKLANQ